MLIVVFLVIIIILKITIKKLIDKHIQIELYQKLLHVGLTAEKHRREFYIFTLSFFGIWFLNFLGGGFNIIFASSLFLFIIPLVFLILSYPSVYNPLICDYIKRRYQDKKIAILDGRVYNTQNASKLAFPKEYPFSPDDWITKIKENGIEIEKISASEISDEYPMIINPFGAGYIEEDTTNLTTLKRIKKYINDGGVFVNIGDLAFWRSWDSINNIEGITSPLVPSYALHSEERTLAEYMNKEKLFPLTPIISGGSHLIDTWLFRNFGVKTTIHPSNPLTVTPVKDYLENIGKIRIKEFRAALNSEKDDSTFIALMPAVMPENKNQRCYPIAAIHQEIGYLVLFGLAISKNGNEFDFVVSVINSLYHRLKEEGKL